MKVNKERAALKKEAIKVGLCEEWTKEWGSESTESLCKKMIRGVDFCLKHNYPSLKHLKKWKGISDEFGIFTDASERIEATLDAYVFNGKSNIIVNVGEYGCTRLYIRHDCTVEVNIHPTAVVMIDLYDNAVIKVNGDCKVFKYGGYVVGECKVVNKYK